MSEPNSLPRSSASCIKAGLSLYRSYFSQIVRRSWAAVLLYAVASSALSMLIITNYSRIIVAETALAAGFEIDTSWVIPLIASLFVAIAVVVVSSAAYGGHMFKMLNEHNETGTIEPGKWLKLRLPLFGRTLKAVLLSALIIILLGAVTALLTVAAAKVLSPKTAMVAVVLVTAVLLLVALLPLGYSIMRYMTLRPSSFLGCYLHGLRAQWSHYGLFFGVMFITGVIGTVLTAVLLLPGNILYIANIQSQMGVFNGDPSGMPSHMMWLFPVVMCFVGVLQAHISMLLSFPIYFLRKTVDTQQQTA